MSTQLSSTRPAIETEQLTKFYGSNRGVLDLEVTVEQGEIFGFLGPNGAGKTTTIRLLMDLIRPTRGHARVFGMDAQLESVAIKALVGYLPGELNLWDNLTGRQILTYLANLRGMPDTRPVHTLAERLQLDLGRRFRDYSKGNKQKVGLIQAFMHQPRLLILDEPTASLDPLNQQEFFLMATEARHRGATVFLSSHVLSEVEHICDRVGMVREGRLVNMGTVRDVVLSKHYHVELTLGVPVNSALRQAFASLRGVSEVEVSDSTLRFVVQGAPDAVIKLAAQYPVISLTSHEPTLEETFLTYYGAEGRPAPDSAEVEEQPAREVAHVR